jgi:Flp pilus assembly protein TadD
MAEATAEADVALAADPDEPHACLGKAWALSDGDAALGLAERAVKGGRGVPALLLLSSLRMRRGELDAARATLDDAGRLAPNDARVTFDGALLAQQRGHYRDAREGYLRALSLDPKMADARYNLAILTHGRGADEEARHHVEELSALAPDDPRLAGLKALLGAK